MPPPAPLKCLLQPWVALADTGDLVFPAVSGCFSPIGASSGFGGGGWCWDHVRRRAVLAWCGLGCRVTHSPRHTHQGADMALRMFLFP